MQRSVDDGTLNFANTPSLYHLPLVLKHNRVLSVNSWIFEGYKSRQGLYGAVSVQ